ncbi:Aconitate hydratase A [Frankliniella fusca]|uniref:Aconitate hydratase A n=1 Tax=Frankliniella fusca TaxID=407009 RepID=A0AAE1H5U8_9NEOP|nr:Aconitate hydratase A [Frankliniella fusca]
MLHQMNVERTSPIVTVDNFLTVPVKDNKCEVFTISQQLFACSDFYLLIYSHLYLLARFL